MKDSETGESREVQEGEHPGASLTEEEREAHMAKVKEIAKAYIDLEKDDRKTYYKKVGDVGYLVNNAWLSEWEEAHYVPTYRTSRDPGFDEKRALSVGPMR